MEGVGGWVEGGWLPTGGLVKVHILLLGNINYVPVEWLSKYTMEGGFFENYEAEVESFNFSLSAGFGYVYLICSSSQKGSWFLFALNHVVCEIL